MFNKRFILFNLGFDHFIKAFFNLLI